MENPKSGRKRNTQKSQSNIPQQNFPNYDPTIPSSQFHLNSQSHSYSQNISSPAYYSQMRPSYSQQIPNFTFSQSEIPSQGISSNEYYQASQDNTLFPMSQHFTLDQTGATNFSGSCRSPPHSDDDEDVDDDDNNEGINLNSQNRRGSQDPKKFWSSTEKEVIVKAWLQVSMNERQNTKQKGAQFWRKVEQTFENVRVYREQCYHEGKENIKECDLLKERGVEPLRNRWKRINGVVSKICGVYAQAEARRRSGQSDDDVMQTAYAIYKSDDKQHKEFQEKSCWEILSKAEVWKPISDTVQKCKKKTATQESGSKRTRINEAGNYSTSTEPNTPSSDGDIGCSSLPTSDGSNKNKNKGKVVNMPSESFQKWLETMQNMNLTRQNETEMELYRLEYDREAQAEKLRVENERIKLEMAKEARKQRKMNLDLFKCLSTKENPTAEEINLRNDLVKVLFL